MVLKANGEPVPCQGIDSDFKYRQHRNGRLAQLVEREFEGLRVIGSIPISSTKQMMRVRLEVVPARVHVPRREVRFLYPLPLRVVGTQTCFICELQ